MKAFFFFAAIISLSYLSACNKDDNNSNGNTKRLTGYTTSLYKDTVTYDYNSSGQIIRVEDNEDVYTFDVLGNQMHLLEYRKTESRQVADATFTLNSDGNIISGHGNFEYNIGAPYTTQFTFTYDASGNLVKRTDARNDGMTYAYEFTWANGDITETKWVLNDSLYLTITKMYFTDMDDKNQIDGNKFLTVTNSFTGNSSVHLVKHSKTVFASDGSVAGDYGYTYFLDSDGYPSTSTINDVAGTYMDIFNYKYQ